MDDPVNCCPRPKGRGQQFIRSSTAPRGDRFDCHTGRIEIVVLLPNSNIHYICYSIGTYYITHDSVIKFVVN